MNVEQWDLLLGLFQKYMKAAASIKMRNKVFQEYVKPTIKNILETWN